MNTIAPAPENASSNPLTRSQNFCRDITRKQARNFYYGLKLLPEPKRSAMYALYAYMRLVDDIADDESNGRTIDQRQSDLNHWQSLTHAAYTNSNSPLALSPGHSQLWPAFTHMLHQYQIPQHLFDAMIDGQRQDLHPVSIPDFPALHQYCYRVASVVGVASLYIFGFHGGDQTLALATDRGIAFQLTNILRDLKEDATRNRCYLPADELAYHHLTPADLTQPHPTPNFLNLMSAQITRAQSYYDKSAPLESLIAPDARPTLAAMTAIYHGILKKIAAHPPRVLQGRTRLSPWSKLQIAYRAMRHK